MKSQCHTGMKLAPVRVFTCKHAGFYSASRIMLGVTHPIFGVRELKKKTRGAECLSLVNKSLVNLMKLSRNVRFFFRSFLQAVSKEALVI